VHTPMVMDQELPRLEGGCKDRARQSRYRTLVRCVLHTAVICRPDIAAAARALSVYTYSTLASNTRYQRCE
jgi:hypothetical protein